MRKAWLRRRRRGLPRGGSPESVAVLRGLHLTPLLSEAGLPVEQIFRLAGHIGLATTETAYRKQIRPVIVHGADVMGGSCRAELTLMLSYSAPATSQSAVRCMPVIWSG